MIPLFIFRTFCRVLSSLVKLEVYVGNLKVDKLPLDDSPRVYSVRHPSTYDPLYVYNLLPGGPAGLATQLAFDMPVVGWVLRGSGFIPVPVKEGDPGRIEAYRACVSHLWNGGSIITCPEGKVCTSGTVKAKSGVARMSYETDVPILPVGIKHTGRLLKKNVAANGYSDVMSVVIGGTTTVRFGYQFYASECPGGVPAATRFMMEELQRLSV